MADKCIRTVPPVFSSTHLKGKRKQESLRVSAISWAHQRRRRRDSIVLTLYNESMRKVCYNLCSSAVERRTTSGWQVMPTDRVCTMELRTLDPADYATFTIIPVAAGIGCWGNLS
jgi:hypothetical protein